MDPSTGPFSNSWCIVLRYGRTHLHPNGCHGSNGTNQQHSLTFCLCFALAHLFGTLDGDLRDGAGYLAVIQSPQQLQFGKTQDFWKNQGFLVFTRLFDHWILATLSWDLLDLFCFRCNLQVYFLFNHLSEVMVPFHNNPFHKGILSESKAPGPKTPMATMA